jgi:hypothetical protein
MQRSWQACAYSPAPCCVSAHTHDLFLVHIHKRTSAALRLHVALDYNYTTTAALDHFLDETFVTSGAFA